jgi:hypothetical protein
MLQDRNTPVSTPSEVLVWLRRRVQRDDIPKSNRSSSRHGAARIRAAQWYRLARSAPGEALLHSENQEATIGPLVPGRRIAHAIRLGEDLVAHSAEFRLDRVNKTDVIGFPQHAFDVAVTIVRRENSGRVAKCIASIRVGSVGKQLFHNIDVTAICGPHQRRAFGDVSSVAVSMMSKQNFDRSRSAALRRVHQRGLAVEVFGVDISAILEKHLHQLDVASFGGKHKCRVTVAVPRIHIGSIAKLGYRRPDVPLIRSRDYRFRIDLF